jgi:hypothetical protein
MVKESCCNVTKHPLKFRVSLLRFSSNRHLGNQNNQVEFPVEEERPEINSRLQKTSKCCFKIFINYLKQ